jgi:hypothetical protein
MFELISDLIWLSEKGVHWLTEGLLMRCIGAAAAVL